jgi:SAM-dependent methyltransferase
VNTLWKKNPKYYWGDPLDVRYYLCSKLEMFQNKKILDLGCNVGILAHFIKQSNHYIGIDINQEALQEARNQHPQKEFIKSDFFSKKTGMKGSFDVVLLSHVLPKDNYPSEHEPIELLEIAKYYLRKQGVIIITTPNPDRCYNRKGKIITPEYLKDMLGRANLQAKIQYWAPWPIQLNHIFKYVPGILIVVEKLSMKQRKSVSYYIEARK